MMFYILFGIQKWPNLENYLDEFFDLTPAWNFPCWKFTVFPLKVWHLLRSQPDQKAMIMVVNDDISSKSIHMTDPVYYTSHARLNTGCTLITCQRLEAVFLRIIKIHRDLMILQCSYWGAREKKVCSCLISFAVLLLMQMGNQNLFAYTHNQMSKSSQMSQSGGYLLANISHFLKLWCHIWGHVSNI